MLDKAGVARAQLGTALALFLDDLDSVSVHTLACAGAEVAHHLAVKSGQSPFADHAIATFPDLKPGELASLRNRYCNSFKHWSTRQGIERDDTDLFEQFSDLKNDHVLFVGWYDYAMAMGQLPIEAQAFQAWYFALHPDKLSPDVDSSRYGDIFPDLLNKTRRDQKRALVAVISAHRQDADIMSDFRTDCAPLISVALRHDREGADSS